MLPARFAPALFGFIVSGFMSLIVTCVATIKAVGMTEGTFGKWMGAWSLCWPIAFTVILIIGPFVRRFVDRLVSPKG